MQVMNNCTPMQCLALLLMLMACIVSLCAGGRKLFLEKVKLWISVILTRLW
jgi:hypothetical protein